MAALDTYGKIKKYVETLTNSSDGYDRDLFCTWLLICMDDIRASISTSDMTFFTSSVSFDIEPNVTEYPLPEYAPGMSDIQYVMLDDVMLCRGSEVLLKRPNGSYKRSWIESGNSIHILPEYVLPDPLPEDFVLPVVTVCGTRAPSDDFFVKTETDDEIVITWQPVDLPVAYRSALAQCVAGRAFMYCEDSGQAAVQFDLADNALKSAKRLGSRKSGQLVANSRKRTCTPCEPIGEICPEPDKVEEEDCSCG